MHKLYTTSQEINNLLYIGTSSFYLGNYMELEDKKFEKLNCISKYNGFLSEYIKCNDKRIPFFKISYPLFIDTRPSNPYLMIERSQISYGPYHYMYLTITTKRIIVFNINHNNKDIVNTFFESFLPIIPTNHIISFCYNNKITGFLDKTSEEIKFANKNDFLVPYNAAGNLETLFKNNNMKNFFYSTTCEKGYKELKENYKSFDPLLIYVVDNPSKCKPNRNCVIVTSHDRKYLFNNNDFKIRDEYDLLLLLFFKDFYGTFEGEKEYNLNTEIFRKLWLDNLFYYSQSLSKRYFYIYNYKNYEGEYASCKHMIKDISAMLCSNDPNSICQLTQPNKENYDVSKILEVLKNIKETYNEEVIKGCEGEIYM